MKSVKRFFTGEPRESGPGSGAGEGFGDGVADVVEGGGEEACDVDAAALDHVDGLLLAEEGDLGVVESAVGEHALLAEEVGEIGVRAAFGESVDEGGAVGGDAVAHGVEFAAPFGAEGGIGEEEEGDGAAVALGVGVDFADDAAHLGEGGLGGVRRGGEHGEGADALAVEAHVLREGGGDEGLGDVAEDGEHALAVGFDAVAEALVGEVEEREPSGVDGGIGDEAPAVGIEIGAGRVMAAGMEQDDVAGGDAGEGGGHGGGIDAAEGGGVVGILLHGEADGGEDGAVVAPRRGGDPERGLRAEAAQELRREAQRARAAERLDDAEAAARRSAKALAEDEVGDGGGIGGEAGDGEVALRGLLVQEAALRAADGLEDRRAARIVHEDADAQVGLR